MREIVALPDPVGEVVDGSRFANGLQMRKVRVPLGVVAVVYEARPNVTIDAAALCLKSGNAIVLRGSSSAAHSNAVLAGVAREAAEANGLPAGALALVAGGGREELAELGAQEGSIDLMIPRGGEGLKRALQAVAKVPVIYAASGNCHVYVDASADLAMARGDHPQREDPAAGRLQRGRDAARPRRRRGGRSCPGALRALHDAGVELRGDERARAGRRRAGRGGDRGGLRGGVPRADPRGARRRLGRRGDRAHRDLRLGALRGDRHRRGRTPRGRSSSASTPPCVYVNASTRFTDGGEFGMGAEIGNSTQKLHARGPIGLRELCAFKYLVEGTGQVRRLAGRVARARPARRDVQPAAPRAPGLRAGGAASQLGLDRVLLVPAATPPHKEVEAEPGVEHRVAMCEAAVAGDERLGVSRADADRDGPAYTVDLLRTLHAAAPGEDELTFIVGGDMARALPTWREPEAILALARLGRRRARGRAARRRRRAAGRARRGPRSGSRSSTCRGSTSPARCCGGAPRRASRCATWRRTRWPSTSSARASTATAVAPATVRRPTAAPAYPWTAAHERDEHHHPQHDTSDPAGLARQIADYAADKKAIDIAELDLRGVLGYTDFFVVCSGNTDRQTKAIHDGIHQGLKKDHGLLPRRVEGLGESRWILMDYLDVIVHVFTPEAREFYRLEQLWGEAPRRAVAE